RAIAERLRDRHPDVPLILFPRGAGPGYADFAETGAFAALSLDATVPPDWAVERLQPHVVVRGNLDPILLVTDGPAMRAEATYILDTLGRGPFIFNLGHGVVPQTPPEHVAELAELIRG